MAARDFGFPQNNLHLARARGGLDELLSQANAEKLSPNSAADALEKISVCLEQANFAALALIAETVAGSCRHYHANSSELSLVVVDLCRRLHDAIHTEQPFDFQGLPPALSLLLFPEDSAIANDCDCGPSVTEHLETPQVALCQCEDSRVLQEFLNECTELQVEAEELLLALEAKPDNAASLNELFRAVHSLKGASGVGDMTSMGQLAHLCENMLVNVRAGEATFDSKSIGLLLQAIDVIGQQLQSVRRAMSQHAPLSYPLPQPRLIQALQQWLSGEGDTCDSCQDTLDHQAAIKSFSQTSGKYQSLSSKESLRVDSSRLRMLIDLIGELVITESLVQREFASQKRHSAMAVGTKLRKVVHEVQQLSMTLKMVPVGSLFQKLNRLVRDLSSKLGKPASLLIEGADTEVDKTLLECVADPLIHLVRNSLDHGVETPAERLAKGKPERAIIRVSAEHRAGDVVFTITDDGRGLDRSKIIQQAQRMGLADACTNLKDWEIDQMIFLPGFSTTEHATEVSGRGVGMDVVRKNIEAMRGTIRLNSTPGEGTTVCLELPLTLSIIDGTVVRVGDFTFVIPTLSIAEQLQYDLLNFIPEWDEHQFDHRGSVLSLTRLGDIVTAEHKPCADKGQVCLIIPNGSRPYGLVVDEIFGQLPVVIKSLGEMLEGINIYVGGALLSDGKIAFVLDVAAISRIVDDRSFAIPQTSPA